MRKLGKTPSIIPEKISGGLEERQMELFGFTSAVIAAVVILFVHWLISEPHERTRRAVAFFGPGVLYGIQTPLRLYRMWQLKRALANLPGWARNDLLSVLYPGILSLLNIPGMPEEPLVKLAIRPCREVAKFALYLLAKDMETVFSVQEHSYLVEAPDSRLDLAAALKYRRQREQLDEDVALCKRNFWSLHGAVRRCNFLGFKEMLDVAGVSYQEHLVPPR